MHCALRSDLARRGVNRASREQERNGRDAESTKHAGTVYKVRASRLSSEFADKARTTEGARPHLARKSEAWKEQLYFCCFFSASTCDACSDASCAMYWPQLIAGVAGALIAVNTN